MDTKLGNTASQQATAISTLPVTHAHPFANTDGHALLSVNAGVPLSLALEQVGTLLECIESIALSDAIANKDTETAALQYLTDIAKALVRASHDGVYEMERRSE